MLTRFALRFVKLVDHVRENGWSRVFRDVVFSCRDAILIEKDLEKATFTAAIFEKLNVDFVELTSELISKGGLQFALKCRHQNALNYLESGYGGHAIVMEGRILGDIWYYPKTPTESASAHKHLRWLGVTLRHGEVYSFDTYLIADARGNNLSAAMDRSSMYALRQKGFKKAYAYYWEDNTAAVWNNRVVYKCKELKKYKVLTIMLFRKILSQETITPDRNLNKSIKENI